MSKTKNLKVFINDKTYKIKVLLSEELGSCLINIKHTEINNLSDSFVGRDFFEAVNELRHQLESIDGQLAIFGARLDVFPSGMARQMSKGLKAYVLEKNQKISTSKLINIFDEYLNMELLASVEKQREYYINWFRSWTNYLNQRS